MKERPILMSAPMVRAILAGQKTQTRRVVKPQPIEDGGSVKFPWATFFRDGSIHTWDSDGVGGQNWDANDFPNENPMVSALARTPYVNPCPYGEIGDCLWVRETFRFPVSFDKESPKQVAEKCLDAGYREPWAPVQYAADERANNPHLLKDFGGTWGRVHSPIHMPRWVSRITLEITGVRVERLQDISEEDAFHEGATGPQPAVIGGDICEFGPSSHRYGFQDIWESINGKGAWAANPFVWVLTFKRVQGAKAEGAI